MSEPTPIDAWGIWIPQDGCWGNWRHKSEVDARDWGRYIARSWLSPVIVAHLSAPAAHRMIRVNPDETETASEPKPKDNQ